MDSRMQNAGSRRLRHKRDVFHAYMVEGAKFSGPMHMPTLEGIQEVPEGIVSFSDAMDGRNVEYDSYIHFFEDDCQFERFWNSPKRYIARLSKFAGVISPDYSVCYDFPNALKVWNTYRNMACGYWLQRNGLKVIPNVRCEPGNCNWSLAGIPCGSVIAVGARACVKRTKDREKFKAALKCAVDRLQPKGIVWYGTDGFGAADYPRSLGIPVYVFPGKGRGNLKGKADV